MKEENTLDFARAFSEAKQRLEANLPFHLNIIEELYIDEVGHSRILAKLFQYQSNSGNYEILESFVDYIVRKVRKESFGSIKVVSPEVTQEKEHIDIWVRDGNNYAIIMENKVYNAVDQEAQLSRYIEKTIKYGYHEDQIYVIYLSQNGGEPDKHSWGNYKEAFQNRYVNLSFRNNILPWLKTFVLPHVRIKETVLRSAIEQYIDYMEGLFDQREQNDTVKMEKEKMIAEKLNLDQFEDGFKKVEVLQNKIEEVGDLYNQLVSLKNKYYDEARERLLFPIIQQWNSVIEKQYPYYEKYSDGRIGLVVPYRGERVNVRISEDNDKQMYCQIDKFGQDNQELPDSIINNQSIRSLLPRHSRNNCVWEYFDINDFNGVFDCFKKVMDLLVQG